jgi:hypothetical protein
MTPDVKVLVYCDPDPIGVLTFLRVPNVGEYIQTDSAMLMVTKVLHNARENASEGAGVMCQRVEHEHSHGSNGQENA